MRSRPVLPRGFRRAPRGDRRRELPREDDVDVGRVKDVDSFSDMRLRRDRGAGQEGDERAYGEDQLPDAGVREVGTEGNPRRAISQPSPPIRRTRGKERREDPQREAARKAVAIAIKRGLLTPLPCQARTLVGRNMVKCGKTPTQAHHWTYHPKCWLDVIWLCREHHDRKRYDK